MTWRTATVACAIAGITSLLLTDILREVIDRRRRRRDGIGGTQDIAIGGIVVGYLFVLGTIISGSLWLLGR